MTRSFVTSLNQARALESDTATRTFCRQATTGGHPVAGPIRQSDSRGLRVRACGSFFNR